jgi:hypothetical protein
MLIVISMIATTIVMDREKDSDRDTAGSNSDTIFECNT